ncbi:MAG TPA: signal peptide peptidase SppA, partial [Xanthomonadales bacterium]|nr:signal peptide peptidase SppA [Xanthomonadales bacterium]
MPEKSTNPFVAFVRFMWRALDFSRRFVLNMIFLLIVVIILAAIAGGMPKLEPKTALLLAPRGDIVEQYTANAADRALAKMFGDEVREVQLRDILRSLDAAAKDPAIDRVVLVPDEISSAGMSTLLEIGAALDRFRESGKEVIAYSDAMDQRGYLLAAHADKVYLHPDGAILLEGIGRYRTYFKSAFDKLGVEARLFRVGEYKSAGEPYIRNDQSPEAREADLFWMGDLWQRYLAEVAKLRKLDAAKLEASILAYDTAVPAAGGDLAKLAKEQGLVDELKTRDEVRRMLIEKGAEDDEHSFRHVDLDDYAQRAAALDVGFGKPKLAVVVAEGEIVDGEGQPGTIGGDTTAMLLRKAREDDGVKAVVLRVDSPGGSVFPSEIIRREVELTRKAGKPVVVSMGDVAASGGYWISMNADTIVASPSTITGSIGIFGLWFNAPQAMDKLGLNTDGVGTTWISGAVDPRRPYDERLGKVIQSVIDRGYQQFIGNVAKAREKSTDEIDAIARGRVWSGAQAKERGLVDQLGTFQDAIALAAKKAKLEDYHLQYIERELSPFEALMVDMSSSV